MTYEVKLSEAIRTASPSKVIIPISMGKSALTGERLKVLLNELKFYGHTPTIIIADTLNRHNSGDKSSDLAIGDEFLRNNNDILEDIIIFRWDDWITGDKKTEFSHKLELVENQCSSSEDILKKLIKTAQKSQSNKSLETSLVYLKEEYAVFLMFWEYDFLVYTKPITDGLASIYKAFRDDKKPHYEFAKVNFIDVNNITTMGLYKQKKSQNNLPFSAQLVIEQVEHLLKSPQISTHHKRLFLDMVINLGTITVDNDVIEGNKNSKNIS